MDTARQPQFSFVDLIRRNHRDRLLVAQDTPGDGNCLFHALTSALHHLQQSVPGHRFPFGPLPLEHGRMRQVIVDFARDNCNVDGCFIDHSNSELNLSQYISANMATPDNAIIHGPNIKYMNVEHYFQARASSCSVDATFSPLQLRSCVSWDHGAQTRKSWSQRRTSMFSSWFISQIKYVAGSMLGLETLSTASFTCKT